MKISTKFAQVKQSTKPNSDLLVDLILQWSEVVKVCFCYKLLNCVKSVSISLKIIKTNIKINVLLSKRNLASFLAKDTTFGYKIVQDIIAFCNDLTH